MRILVIDDDPNIRNFLKTALESECFEVDQAEDGEEGLFLANTNDFDLLILDNNMPKKSGRDVCKEIRAENKNLPILMLSVVTEPLTKADILNIGADDYLTKPFSFEELLARIRALLRRPRELSEDNVRIDDLVIDIKGHTVTRDNTPIKLTVKEFMLLELLARNMGKVISRGVILEHVWDMNADPFSNTIEVHIANLRKKIDGKSQTKLIQTVPGVGYKIEKQN